MIYNTERPYKFDNMVGQTSVVENIRGQSKKNKFFHAYLFVGQWGGGKTTMARILAASVNCNHKDERGNPCGECDSCKAVFGGNHPDVIELDAASNNGVESIRSLKESVAFLPQSASRKVYIIDEVHMLSNNAWNALLKVLEEPPSHVLFILCTTELKKVPNTVRSRCAMYQFRQVTEEEMYPAVENVCKKHGFSYTQSGLNLLIKNSHGSMRDVLSLLEQVAEGEINEQNVSDMLGISNQEHLLKLMDSLLDRRTPDAIRLISELEDMGKDLFLAVNDLLDMAADGIMCCMAGKDAIKGTAYYCEVIWQFSLSYNSCMWSELISELLKIREELSRMPGRTSFICGIIRMNEENSMAALLERIERLEKGIVAIPESKEQKNSAEPVMQEEAENEEEDISFKETESEESVEKEQTFFEDVIKEKEQNATILSETVAKNAVDKVEEEKEVKKEPPVFGIPNAFSFLNSIAMYSSFETVPKKEEKKISTGEVAQEYIAAHPEEEVFSACIEASTVRVEDDGEIVYETPFPPIETILSAYDVPQLKHRLAQ